MDERIFDGHGRHSTLQGQGSKAPAGIPVIHAYPHGADGLRSSKALRRRDAIFFAIGAVTAFVGVALAAFGLV